MTTQDFRSMTSDSIGKDLLQALVQEIRLLPKPWDQLTKSKQDDVIDRLRARVETNVRMAVHLLASEGRTTIVADLDQITRKDGIKAVFKINVNAEGRHELFDSEGKACLIIVADVGDHLNGLHEVSGEDDQRAMDLGHEYHDNDGGGMDEATTIEGEVLGLPSPDQVKPTEEELQASFEEGFHAAEAGKPESDCPVIRSELVIEWVRGWKYWHEQNATNDETDNKEAA